MIFNVAANKGLLMKLTAAFVTLLLSSAVLLSACSAPNSLQQHIGEHAVINQIADGNNQGMFRIFLRIRKQNYCKSKDQFGKEMFICKFVLLVLDDK